MKGKELPKARTFVPRKVRLRVFKKAHWRCERCDRYTPRTSMGTKHDNAPTVDHIVPVSKGGTNTRKNLQLLCRSCNQEKGDDMPEENVA